MNQHEHYALYQCYLSSMNMSAGTMGLLLISRSFFEQFVERYESDPFFRSKHQLIFKNLLREKKIRSLSDGYDKEELTNDAREEARCDS